MSPASVLAGQHVARRQKDHAGPIENVRAQPFRRFVVIDGAPKLTLGWMPIWSTSSALKAGKDAASNNFTMRGCSGGRVTTCSNCEK